MLIKALNEYYDILASAGKVCKEGMSVQNVSFKIMLRPDGTISDILDIREESLPDSKGNVKKTPVEIILPERTQKPGIYANIIEHRPLYIFGLNYDKGKFSTEDEKGRAKKSHDCFVKRNLEFTEGMTDEIVCAYRNFIKNWNPENETENPHLINLKKNYSSGYYCFALDGHPDEELHKTDGEVVQKYLSSVKEDEAADGICSISGEKGRIARLHNKIKGVPGGLATGGLLVCFNSNAEESYGKEQSYNSGISEKTMKRYTEALNILLSNKDHKMYLDDMTVVFWAMSEDDSRETDLLLRMLGEKDDELNAEEADKMIFAIMKDLRDGKEADLSSFNLNENVMFYITGLVPNNSRIAQKFIYRDKFGKMLRNVAMHQNDLRIEGTKKQISIRRLFYELKSPKSTNEKISPPLMAAIFNSVINGTRYPDSLLETAVRRVKIDKNVNYVKAGIIKACLNRKIRINKITEEIKMALDRENANQAYLCGRLFAVLERIQQNASEGKLNRTIKDSYFSSACSNPAAVFPRLMKLAQYHLGKDEYATGNNILIGEITDKLNNEFPKTLPLNEQGMFIIGYYHQYQNFFKKNEE
jgi:CRISPR-associated protein Csd1